MRRQSTRLSMGELLAHLDYLEEAAGRLSVAIEELVAPFAEHVGLLRTIPGVDRRTAEVLGHAMTKLPISYVLTENCPYALNHRAPNARTECHQASVAERAISAVMIHLARLSRW
jgi:hypothetical protein